jgi:hypothetical protein
VQSDRSEQLYNQVHEFLRQARRARKAKILEALQRASDRERVWLRALYRSILLAEEGIPDRS